MVQQGINVVLSFNNKALAGQQNIALSRNVSNIDITNKIDGNWREYLPGLKTWSVNCNGMYVVDDDSFKTLENCFMNNQEIEVKLILDEKTYTGTGIITDFPLSGSFNSQFKYQVKVLGTGELNEV